MPGRTDVYDNNVVNHNCSYEMSQSHTTAPTCSNSMRVDELSESNWKKIKQKQPIQLLVTIGSVQHTALNQKN